MRWQLSLAGLALMILIPASSHAYTIVLRGGDRVNIGDFYWLTGSAMSWVTAGGERRTVDLGGIDLDATATYNGEAVAAFIDRAISRGAAIALSAPRAPIQAGPGDEAITITTADLAPLREERERDEAERRAGTGVLPPLGMPSNVDDDDVEATAAIAEDRWREEARLIREEIDAEQAQIDGLRNELAYRDANPRKFRLSAEYNFGRGAIVVDRRGGYRFPAYGYTSGSTYNRADDEYSQMNSRLIDLEIVHRGTQSRWNAFLERARRAGVPPGWLRE